MTFDKPPVVYDDFLPFFPEASGNDVNGLGEKNIRRPSPFFWHPPDQHAYGELQRKVIGIQRRSPDITAHYSHKAPRGPAPIEKAGIKIEKSAQDWTEAVKTFALAHEGDIVGIARMDPLYVYEGYELTHSWVVIVGVYMEHAELNNLPPSLENTRNPVEVARQYIGAARACR